MVVLDTNLVLSALVFASGRLAPLRSAWQTGRCIPLASHATASELMHVLAYPKFKLSPTDSEELLADYLPYCRSARSPVTGDKDWLILAAEFNRPILTAEVLLARLDGASKED